MLLDARASQKLLPRYKEDVFTGFHCRARKYEKCHHRRTNEVDPPKGGITRKGNRGTEEKEGRSEPVVVKQATVVKNGGR